MEIKRIFQDIQEPGYFVVDWMLHDKCTYDCSYCPPHNKLGNDDWLNLDVLDEFCNNLEQHVKQLNPDYRIHALFTGGEPTVWKDFGTLVERLKDRGWYISVNSNGSRTKRWWEEYAQHFDSITLSYHTESVNDDEFIEKVKICEKYTRTSVNVMLNPNTAYFNKAIQFSHRVKQETTNAIIVHHSIQHVFGKLTIGVPFYTNDQKEIIATLENKYPNVFEIYKDVMIDNYYIETVDNQIVKLNGLELINQKKVNFENWSCSIGLESIFIDAKGYILRGTCRAGEKMGTILKSASIKWAMDPIICPFSWCGCITDIMNSKENLQLTRS